MVCFVLSCFKQNSRLFRIKAHAILFALRGTRALKQYEIYVFVSRACSRRPYVSQKHTMMANGKINGIKYMDISIMECQKEQLNIFVYESGYGNSCEFHLNI